MDFKYTVGSDGSSDAPAGTPDFGLGCSRRILGFQLRSLDSRFYFRFCFFYEGLSVLSFSSRSLTIAEIAHH